MQRLSSNDQMKLVNLLIESKQINADLKRTQRKYCDINSRDVYVPDGKRVYVRLPTPSSTEKGAAIRFIRRYDGPFLVVGHVHGLEGLLDWLRQLTTDKQLGVVNIEKTIVIPNGDPCADSALIEGPLYLL